MTCCKRRVNSKVEDLKEGRGFGYGRSDGMVLDSPSETPINKMVPILRFRLQF